MPTLDELLIQSNDKQKNSYSLDDLLNNNKSLTTGTVQQVSGEPFPLKEFGRGIVSGLTFETKGKPENELKSIEKAGRFTGQVVGTIPSLIASEMLAGTPMATLVARYGARPIFQSLASGLTTGAAFRTAKAITNQEEPSEAIPEIAKTSAEFTGLNAIAPLFQGLRKLFGEKIPEAIFNKIIEPSTKQFAQDIRNQTETLGEEIAKHTNLFGSKGMMLTKSRLEISRLENEIQDGLKATNEEELSSGYNTIFPENVTKPLDKLAEEYKSTGINSKEVNVINKIKNDFLKNQPETLDVQTANQIKRRLYQNIGDKNYLKSFVDNPAKLQAERTIANSLKNQIEQSVPEIKPLNDQLGLMIETRDNLIGAMSKAERSLTSKFIEPPIETGLTMSAQLLDELLGKPLEKTSQFIGKPLIRGLVEQSQQ